MNSNMIKDILKATKKDILRMADQRTVSHLMTGRSYLLSFRNQEATDKVLTLIMQAK